MSADNWADCPRCDAKRMAALEADERKLDEAYGTVPLDQFDEMRKAFRAKCAERMGGTFREDYEIGLYGGEFYVTYRGSCDECDLTHDFTYQEKVQ